MIDLKKVYEDAIMAAGDAGAAVGDIAPASSASAGDADIVPSKGSMTTTDDVLGKHCDHHKDGYLGPGCFHIPYHAKHEVPSKKRKGWKNPYTKGMKVLTDAELGIDGKDSENIKALEAYGKEKLLKDLNHNGFKFGNDLQVAFVPKFGFIARGKIDSKLSFLEFDFTKDYGFSLVDGIADNALCPLDQLRAALKDKKLKVLTDAELSRDIILDIHKVDEYVLQQFLQSNWNFEKTPVKEVVSIAYYPPNNTFFIKAKCNDNGHDRIYYVQADFKNKKFVPSKQSLQVYNTAEMKQEFKKIHTISKDISKEVDRWNLWVIWGDAK